MMWGSLVSEYDSEEVKEAREGSISLWPRGDVGSVSFSVVQSHCGPAGNFI